MNTRVQGLSKAAAIEKAFSAHLILIEKRQIIISH